MAKHGCLTWTVGQYHVISMHMGGTEQFAIAPMLWHKLTAASKFAVVFTVYGVHKNERNNKTPEHLSILFERGRQLSSQDT